MVEGESLMLKEKFVKLVKFVDEKNGKWKTENGK